MAKLSRSMTYTEFVTLIQAGQLYKGEKITITDYRTVHYMFDGITRLDDINEGPIEPLTLTALSTNEVSPIATSTLYPQDIIHYDWKSDHWIWDPAFSNIVMPEDNPASLEGVELINGYKGVIYRREDTKNNNILGYDFRHIKFRRWKYDYPIYDENTTYQKGDRVEVPQYGVVISLVDDNTNNPVQDWEEGWGTWSKIIDYEYTEYWCNNSYISYDPDDYEDYYTFQGFDEYNTYEINVKNNVFENIHDSYKSYNEMSMGSSLSNNVFYLWGNFSDRQNFRVMGNKLGIYGELNTFGDFFSFNTIGNIFYNNIGESFSFNTIGNIFYNNITGIYFESNTIKNYFEENTISTLYSNIIGTSFSNNTIGSSGNNNIGNNFHDNIIGNQFDDNTIVNDFVSNSIGDYFYDNIIGNNFHDNNIGNSFQYNNIGNYFNYNTTKNGFNNNTIGYDFRFNTIEDGFNKNTIENSFQFNTIGEIFTGNSINYNFSQNIIGSNFSRNTIGNDFNNNNIGNNFKHNSVYNLIENTNFTNSTHVTQTYTCEIFRRQDNTIRIKYYDNNDQMVVVAVNV